MLITESAVTFLKLGVFSWAASNNFTGSSLAVWNVLSYPLADIAFD